MKTLFAVLALVAILAPLFWFWVKASSGKLPNKLETARARPPLTEREQAMYNRLTQCLPGKPVLAQVSFSALLDARSRAVRNTFDRKTADFVVCDAAFDVLAIVELDDSSHKGKERRDESRDALLTAAGYRVLRYKAIPDVDRVIADFASETGNVTTLPAARSRRQTQTPPPTPAP